MREYLAARGVRVPDKVGKGKIGNSNFNIVDPDGHTVEIVQYEPDSWTRQANGKYLPDACISSHMTHVGVTVRKLDAAMSFYGGLLDFHEFWRGSSSGSVLSWVNMNARAQAANYTRPIDIKVGKNGKRQANLFDPDGTRIELMEPATLDGKPIPPSTAPPPD